jgi:hypothetical protein
MVGGRKLPSWIEGFVRYTEGTQSPEIFRKWAAVSIIAGALERKVFLKVFKRTLYANLYVILVGGPGVGKTDALRNVRGFWEELPDLKIAPTSVSRASLTDELNGAVRQILRPTELVPVTKFNSLQVCAEEFGTFLTQYETEFMSTLNHLYDCVSYTEKKRSMKEPIVMPEPQLNIIAATTPAWLSGTLPDTAWAEGFSSRLVMVYSGDRIKIDPFRFVETDAALHAVLVEELRDVHNLFGAMSFEEEFVEQFRQWYMADCPPLPTHPRLEHYIPRRHVHFLKLCMVMSASRSSDMVVRMVDYQNAMDFLLEAEATMADVFKAMRTSTDANVLDEAFNFVWTTFTKENKAVAEHRIIHFLAQRVPTHSVAKMLEVMISSQMIELAALGEKGRNTYRPAPRASHNA